MQADEGTHEETHADGSIDGRKDMSIDGRKDGSIDGSIDGSTHKALAPG